MRKRRLKGRAAVFRSLAGAAVLFLLLGVAASAEEGPGLVDWLKARGEDASFASRRTRFDAHFPGETYAGTAEQNVRLLRVLRDGAPPGGRRAPAPSQEAGRRTAYVQGWRVELDLGPQVLRLSAPPDPDVQSVGRGEATGVRHSEPALLARPTGTGRIVSAALLGQKAKQFDDGLYAAVEMATQSRKQAWLQRVARRLEAAASPSSTATLVRAAALLGQGWGPTTKQRLRPEVAEALQRFERDPLRSKPLGFYTWSPQLAWVFRQDRMLQTEPSRDASLQALVALLHQDEGLRDGYVGMLELAEQLTNPFPYDDLRVFLRGARPEPPVHLVPPSRSHEIELFKRLWARTGVPEGAELMDELVRAVREGRIDLEPGEDAGWYDRQTWALDPFLRPEATAEAARLVYEASYREYLEQLFRGLLALTRETHVKQLELGLAATSPAPRVTLNVAPDLSVEPQVTHYRRRADAYAFVRRVIEANVGEGALRHMHRLTADGPVSIDLDTELRFMENLFRGAAQVASREIGLSDTGDAAASRAAIATYEAWRTFRENDPDLARDARMMVPIFRDADRGMTKVWVFLGWTDRPLHVTYARTPEVVACAPEGPDAARTHGGGQPEIVWAGQFERIACPVMAEVYVTRLLDRDAFRAHCDRYQTKDAILAHLR